MNRRQSLGALLAGAGLLGAPTGQAAALVPVGGELPDALLSGLNGPDRRLRAFRGAPLIINVWASWCGPCRAEMPSLERLLWSQQTARFALIGISTDDDRASAERWLRDTHATISHYIDHAQQLESMLGASRIPLTVLVDARGRVVERVMGARQWDSTESLALVRRAFGPRGEK